jgi:predicted DNA-binding transcriptional regulator AlpA
MKNNHNQNGLLRLWQIVGDPKKNLPPLIPISKSSWWMGVKIGRFPQPIKLGPRTTCWRAEDIYALIDSHAVEK